jgi:hypothetical protein
VSRHRLAFAPTAALMLGLGVVVALTRTRLGDYQEGIVSDDNAAPAIRALLDGDLSRFADVQPIMGLVSLLVRLPFAALAGADGLWTYRLGILPCLLAAAVVAAVIDARLARDQRPALVRLLVASAIFLNPLTFAAMDAGHPEEILGGALLAGAVLAALDGRSALAAMLLGLAIATKQWALLGVVPVLLALPGRRLTALVLSAAVASAFVLPGPLANLARYRAAADGIASVHRVYPESAWWPTGATQQLRVDLGGGESAASEIRRLPFALTRGATQLLTLLLVIAVSAAVWRRRDAARREDALALLAAALLLRTVLDPVNLAYYGVPALMALGCWEVLRRPGLPLATVAALVGATVTFTLLDGAPTSVRCASFLLWAPAVAAWLAFRGRAAAS